jgi:hypothetical protein
MSQTSHEFVRTPERREVYENCDVKCLFYAESVSDETQDYYDFSEDEIRFIQTAARGQDSGYSECLLATSSHGRRRLEIRSGPFEHHVLDDKLDPWDWLREVEGFEDPQDLEDRYSTSVTDDLEATDLPSVMSRDRDIEQAMTQDSDEGVSVIDPELSDSEGISPSSGSLSSLDDAEEA